MRKAFCSHLSASLPEQKPEIPTTCFVDGTFQLSPWLPPVRVYDFHGFSLGQAREQVCDADLWDRRSTWQNCRYQTTPHAELGL